jgi:endonuclease-3
MSPACINHFFVALQAANPEPKTELEYCTPFELLVAVSLSAQATDTSVNKATQRLFAVANTPRAMLALGQAGLEEYIKTIGLYRNKAKHLMAACQMLIERFGGQVPHTREELQSLPGVGRKTANVILNVAFGEPTIAVDTHIFRVANRTGLAPGKTPDAVEQALLLCVPQPYRQHAHHWLILLGRYICTARTPKCGQCLVAAWCGYADKTPGQASNGTRRQTKPAHDVKPHTSSAE